MKGIHITTSTDYTTGPGPRVVMTIDCENIPENYWCVEMKEELLDRFGDIPKETEMLIEVAMLRVMAAEAGVCEISGNKLKTIFKFE